MSVPRSIGAGAARHAGLCLRPRARNGGLSRAPARAAALSRGGAGTGKTEIAKALSAGLGRRLVRLQCYEGLDTASAVFEWNFAEQMIAIRTAEAAGGVERGRLKDELFTEGFLIERPLL